MSTNILFLVQQLFLIDLQKSYSSNRIDVNKSEIDVSVLVPEFSVLPFKRVPTLSFFTSFGSGMAEKI